MASFVPRYSSLSPSGKVYDPIYESSIKSEQHHHSNSLYQWYFYRYQRHSLLGAITQASTIFQMGSRWHLSISYSCEILSKRFVVGILDLIDSNSYIYTCTRIYTWFRDDDPPGCSPNSHPDSRRSSTDNRQEIFIYLFLPITIESILNIPPISFRPRSRNFTPVVEQSSGSRFSRSHPYLIESFDRTPSRKLSLLVLNVLFLSILWGNRRRYGGKRESEWQSKWLPLGKLGDSDISGSSDEESPR